MNLTIIPARFTDFAWRDGAYKLGESCVEECTPDQLKMLISKGERTLLRLDTEEGVVGWCAIVEEQRPNLRILFVTNLWARHGHFERFYDQLRDMAERSGCSRIRCAALPAQARMFKRLFGFKPVYETLEVLV